VAVARFRELRSKILPFAEAQGLLTDEDVFRVSFVRIFWTTNVLVSAFASRGLSADLLEVVTIEHELVTGEAY
jgi:hypothetical protein